VPRGSEGRTQTVVFFAMGQKVVWRHSQRPPVMAGKDALMMTKETSRGCDDRDTHNPNKVPRPTPPIKGWFTSAVGDVLPTAVVLRQYLTHPGF
jgi:hypothetical protein